MAKNILRTNNKRLFDDCISSLKGKNIFIKKIKQYRKYILFGEVLYKAVLSNMLPTND